jgi:vanillate/4-hydroxybenzoate decarboxylase subunit C
VLDQEHQLLRITEQVSLEPDLAAAACALAKMGEATPAIQFEVIAGYNNARVVLNVYGSWPNHALALGMEKDTPLRDQFFEFVRRYHLYPGELDRVDTAPWQEVVVDKDVNLYDVILLFRLNSGDAAFFLDKACIISRDPDGRDNDNVENVGVYRLQVKGRPGRHTGRSAARHRAPYQPCRGARRRPPGCHRARYRTRHYIDGGDADALRSARIKNGGGDAG